MSSAFGNHSTSSETDLGAGNTAISVIKIPCQVPPGENGLSGPSPRETKFTVHTLQYQPTNRPIEDRFSINATPFLTDSLGITVLLGVYDGHRGAWTADYVSKALPDKILADSKIAPFDVAELFEKFDRDMILAFQEAHSVPASSATSHSTLRALKHRFLRQDKEKKQSLSQEINQTQTPIALRSLSGCSASIVELKIPFDRSKPVLSRIINLGDSRTIIASTQVDRTILASSTDVNSRVEAEMAHILAQHPVDNPNDVFVGKRLFGDTLSTRAFGDAVYKMPIRESVCVPLTKEEKHAHRYLVERLSEHDNAARIAEGKEKVISVAERYDALFSSYLSPPYASARPDVTDFKFNAGRNNGDSQDVVVKDTAFIILATDGLWDLVGSDEAANIVREAISIQGQKNLAQILLNQVTQKKKRTPGDDVTILVLVL